MKIIKLFLIGLLIFVPFSVFADHAAHTGKKVGASPEGFGSTTAITATLTAPTANRFALLSCVVIQAWNTGTGTTGALEFFSLGMSPEIKIVLGVDTTANGATATYSQCFASPLRASARQQAITMTGVSNDDDTRIKITLVGYEGL